MKLQLSALYGEPEPKYMVVLLDGRQVEAKEVRFSEQDPSSCWAWNATIRVVGGWSNIHPRDVIVFEA